MRVYIDTSVFGGCFDEEFSAVSRSLFEAVSRGEILPLVSEVTARELEAAPRQVRDFFARTLERAGERVEVSEEAVLLAHAYIGAGVVAKKWFDDALHVALATLARADVFVSWNFRHPVSPVRIRAFNNVNAVQGHGQVVIMTPADVVHALEGTDETED